MSDANELLWIVYAALPAGFLLDLTVHSLLVYWHKVRR